MPSGSTPSFIPRLSHHLPRASPKNSSKSSNEAEHPAPVIVVPYGRCTGSRSHEPFCHQTDFLCLTELNMAEKVFPACSENPSKKHGLLQHRERQQRDGLFLENVFRHGADRSGRRSVRASAPDGATNGVMTPSPLPFLSATVQDCPQNFSRMPCPYAGNIRLKGLVLPAADMPKRISSLKHAEEKFHAAFSISVALCPQLRQKEKSPQRITIKKRSYHISTRCFVFFLLEFSCLSDTYRYVTNILGHIRKKTLFIGRLSPSDFVPGGKSRRIPCKCLFL